MQTISKFCSKYKLKNSIASYLDLGFGGSILENLNSGFSSSRDSGSDGPSGDGGSSGPGPNNGGPPGYCASSSPGLGDSSGHGA
ncbi:unnamed protein product [Ambrosiozyma monospora]|uniref:Unnamed protein product n=1 Tax=Ambrosiozyma monospora TaxID=43982 RepID=A0A9W6WGY5_AMBMO|nr:unnamed protein product [Ambrosiozyma monospora]